MGLEAWRPRPPSREPDRLSRRRGHPAGPRPWHGCAGCSHSCSAWTKMPLSGRVPPRSLPPVSCFPGVSAGREELPRGAVHLLQLPACTAGARTSGSLSIRVHGPGPGSRSPLHQALSLVAAPGDHGRERPCPAGGQVGKQAWRRGLVEGPTVVPGNSVQDLGSPAHGGGAGSPGRRPRATKSAQTSCRGDAAHYSQRSRGWSLRACLGQIVATSVPIPTAEGPEQVPSTIQVSVPPSVPWTEDCLRPGGGERCPRLRLCSALRPPSPHRRLRAHLSKPCDLHCTTVDGQRQLMGARPRRPSASSPTCGGACLENVRLFNTA